MDQNVDVKLKHPKGLYVLFVTEMWERFSYYGMRALFVLYMAKALLFDKDLGSQIYGSYTGLVYLTPLIGGYVADRYWGNRKSIIIGGLLMAAGQFMMFISGSLFHNIGTSSVFMFIGLGLLIFGNGFFKPNISTMVGQLYPAGDKRIDSAFTIFYMGINLGAFIAPLLCGYLGDTGDPADFKWGFLAACFGMIISGVAVFLFLLFMFGLNFSEIPGLMADFIKKPLSYSHQFGGIDFDLIGSVIFSLAIAIPALIISDPSLNKIEKQRIAVIYIACFFVIFFWSAFEQAGASLTYFAEEQTERHLFGWQIPASYFQSVNAVAIVIFAPLFALLWTALGKRNMEPASPFKQAMGLFLLAMGYLLIAFGVKGLLPGVKVSMIWLLALYTIHTFGELCLSPIGLSMVNKLSPVRLASLLMGVYFLANATANKFAGTLSGLYPESVVPTEVVQKVNADHKFTILKDNAKVKEYNGKTVYLSEMIDYSIIKDENEKKSVIITVEGASIVKAKSFVGFKIENLYQFFMIFVFMAGIASVILFFIASWMVKMMHGVR